MKVTYRVKGLSNLKKSRGRVIYRNVTLNNVPDKTINLDSYPADNSIDFRDLIKDDSMDLIIDWNVELKRSKVSQKDKISYILKNSNLTDQLKIDIAVMFDRLKDDLKGLTLEKKMTITIKALEISYDSQTEILDKIRNYKETKEIELKDSKKEHGKILGITNFKANNKNN